MTKLSLEDIEQIKPRIAAGEALQAIGTAYGVSKQTIWNIKNGKYSLEFRSGAKSARALRKPKPSFADLTSDEIAEQVEKDIRSEARKWKKKHAAQRGKRVNVHTAATATAALYLQKHNILYMRENTQALKDAHQQWMDVMREWFVSTVEKGKKA